MKIGRFLFLVLCVLVAGTTIRYGLKHLSLYGSIAGHAPAPPQHAVPAYVRSLHPKYPYSIIPGGAYSAAELRNADRDDAVVKQHYADFNLRNARMVQLADDRYQYVSYRMHQRVYWTKRKLRIPKGELLLTDGRSWARARCGNRLSAIPRGQTSSQEPSEAALSAPPMQLGTPMDLAATPALGDISSVSPDNDARFPPVLPSDSGAPPPELQPLVHAPPATPSLPAVAQTLAPPISVSTPAPQAFTVPSVTPPTTSLLIPPSSEIPPISSVPEPKAVYLFLVTFVMSLYGLTRMIPGADKPDIASVKE